MDFNILAAVFVVVVVGGMGSIAGAFLAAVLISELGAFGILVIPQSTLVLMFAVMAVVLIFRPWGLLGRPEAPGQHGQVGPPEPPLRPPPPRLRAAGLTLLPALLAVPAFADGFTLVLAVEVAIMALFATSLHFAMGPGGMVSFGHAAFFGGARTRPPSSSSTRARRWRSRSSSPPRWPGCSPSSSAGSACA